MRATVGPLPSTVYWRRRAVVLGAILLGVIVLFVSCSGEDNNTKTKNASSQYPTPAPDTSGASGSPSPTTSFAESVPGAGPALPDPADLLTDEPDEDALPTSTAASTGTNNGAVLPADGSCADTEFSVTPIPAQTTVKRGVPVDIRLKVKNIGTRTCTRDVGADQQELYLGQAAQKTWSSDPCSTVKGSDPRSFAPGAEREYTVTWNGRQSTQCASGAAAGPVVPAGQYELRARVGTLISNPAVILSVTA
jgi:hypothetical protein